MRKHRGKTSGCIATQGHLRSGFAELVLGRPAKALEDVSFKSVGCARNQGVMIPVNSDQTHSLYLCCQYFARWVLQDQWVPFSAVDATVENGLVLFGGRNMCSLNSLPERSYS